MYVVTGASYGIGNAVASRLASRGLSVLAVARSSHRLNELSAGFPDQITPVCADVATRDGLEMIVSKLKRGDTVSGLVYSAGSRVSPESYLSISSDELVEHFQIHVASQIKLIQLLKKMAH